MSILRKQIGNKIKETRILNGLSREQVARKIGVKAQQIYKYECGFDNISIERMILIAKALKKDITYFLIIDGEDN